MNVVTNMSQKETIRRILKEETKLIPVILRRVEIDKLNEQFNESLEHTSDMFFRDPEMTLDMFTHIVISMTIDGIHYDIHSTTHEDSQWYDDVFNSLKEEDIHKIIYMVILQMMYYLVNLKRTKFVEQKILHLLLLAQDHKRPLPPSRCCWP